MSTSPVWVPGLNCTGYQLGTEWLGFVSWAPEDIGVPGNRADVRWNFLPDDSRGYAPSLHEAKEIIEQKWKRSQPPLF